jgi:outer membrane receptor for monomeric catechols
MFRYGEALCCGNTTNIVIFVKSLCLNFMTYIKNNMKMLVQRLWRWKRASKSKKTQRKTWNKLRLNGKSFVALIKHNTVKI